MKRSVTITLDKKRTLKYTWGSLRYLKDTHNLLVGSLDDMAEDWTLVHPWLVAGLIHEDPDLTVETLEDKALNPDDIVPLIAKIIDAMGLAEKNDAPKNPTVSLQTTTGVSSIKSPTAA